MNLFKKKREMKNKIEFNATDSGSEERKELEDELELSRGFSGGGEMFFLEEGEEGNKDDIVLDKEESKDPIEATIEDPPFEIPSEEFKNTKEEFALHEKVVLAMLHNSERSLCSAIEVSHVRMREMIEESNREMEAFVKNQNKMLSGIWGKNEEDDLFVEIEDTKASSSDKKVSEKKEKPQRRKGENSDSLLKKMGVIVAFFIFIYLALNVLVPMYLKHQASAKVASQEKKAEVAPEKLSEKVKEKIVSSEARTEVIEKQVKSQQKAEEELNQARTVEVIYVKEKYPKVYTPSDLKEAVENRGEKPIIVEQKEEAPEKEDPVIGSDDIDPSIMESIKTD